jgi:hypothetical protein
MHRTAATVIAAVTLAVAGATVATTPAHAVVATPVPVGATPSPSPCPLTPAQIASGRRTVAAAHAALNHGWEVIESMSTTPRPSFTAVGTPSSASDAETCLLALADVEAKQFDAGVASGQLAACMLTGASCANELRNASSALHDLEVAINALQWACPWLSFG